MLEKQLIEYKEERFYSMARMSVLLILTFISFFISSDIFPQIQLVQLLFGGLMIMSLVYHTLITYKPESLVAVRKNFLLLMDYVVLTFLINIFGEHGIYLLPLYALIVMQSSVSYGLNYYISGALIATASLGYLAMYSPYWKGEYDVIIAFGITTLLVPLFYIKSLLRMDEKIEEVEEKIAYVEELEEQINIELVNVADRDTYKDKMKELIKAKDSFTLLFISIQQVTKRNEDEHILESLLQEVVDDINNILDEDDLFARLNGHEFAIITKKQRVFLRKYLRKLEDTIISTHLINGKAIRIEPNIGVALYPEDAQNEMILGKCADEAMNIVKENPNVHHLFYRGLTS